MSSSSVDHFMLWLDDWRTMLRLDGSLQIDMAVQAYVRSYPARVVPLIVELLQIESDDSKPPEIPELKRSKA